MKIPLWSFDFLSVVGTDYVTAIGNRNLLSELEVGDLLDITFGTNYLWVLQITNVIELKNGLDVLVQGVEVSVASSGEPATVSSMMERALLGLSDSEKKKVISLLGTV